MSLLRERLRDPRVLQIAFLSSFLLFGVALFELDVPVWLPPLLLVSTCGTQWLFTVALGEKRNGYLSPVITALGLSLLLRTDAVWVAPLAGFLAIASKFVLRRAGKHFFNPTTFGLGVAMLCTRHAWCSPSQWGDNAALAAWFVILGLAVVQRAFRSDVTVAFLVSWVLLKAGRVLYLGQRPEVLLHQLTAGSLILFAFFMISDPKTTPAHRVGRILLAAGVATLAFCLQTFLWWNNALIWSLLMVAPAVPLLDRLFPAERYRWPTEASAVPTAA